MKSHYQTDCMQDSEKDTHTFLFIPDNHFHLESSLSAWFWSALWNISTRETMHLANKTPHEWQFYHILISEKLAKTSTCQRRVLRRRCAVCAEEQWSHERFDLWTKLRSRKVSEGNHIIKLSPSSPSLSDFFCPFRNISSLKSRSPVLMLLEGTWKKAFAKDNMTQRNFKL